MTEDEAKTKWCPFARTVQTDGKASSGPRNRIANTDTMTTDAERLIGVQCIGSACMAFRTWSVVETITTEPSSTSVGVRYENRGGVYCGLAGTP